MALVACRAHFAVLSFCRIELLDNWFPKEPMLAQRTEVGFANFRSVYLLQWL